MTLKSQQKSDEQDSERIRNRMQQLFGNPNLKIEDIVKPIGEKEMKDEVERLKEHRERILKENARPIKELLEEVLKETEKEYETIMEEMSAMRQEQLGGIEEQCENINTMCCDLKGYIEQVEQDVKDLEEELVRAKDKEKKLKEDIDKARNQELQKSWDNLRKGNAAMHMSDMMRKKAQY